MGNANAALSLPCIKIISHGGATTILHGDKHYAGEVISQFLPNGVVYHADSFFLGSPVPSIALQDRLQPGETYFLLPIDCFKNNNNIFSVTSLVALASKNKAAPPLRLHDCKFQYLKGADGRGLIKVDKESIATLITWDNDSDSPMTRRLCTTPELQKHYDQMVGRRDLQTRSPKLETIYENKCVAVKRNKQNPR